MSKVPLSEYASYVIDSVVDPAAVTNYGGIFPYLDLMLLTDLPGIVSRVMPAASERGWRQAEYVASLLAVNITGGECVDDLDKLRADPGIALYMGQITRAIGGKRRFARGGEGVLPSVTCVRDWLETFHDKDEELKRKPKIAFVPAPNAALTALQDCTQQFTIAGWQVYRRADRREITKATLELDATFMETQKKTALTCYKHFEAYSALTMRWAETGFVVWNEFRDGNVPPAYHNTEAVFASVTRLNRDFGINDVWFRSDSAACQNDLMDGLDSWQVDGKRCPVRFAIGYKKTQAFRTMVRQQEECDWTPVYDKQGKLKFEIAEVPFVSNHEALVKGEPYRHIAARRLAKQGMLPGIEVNQPDNYGVETMEMNGKAYHVFAIISNIPDWTPIEIISWYNERCGNGEEIHSILKSDLAGGLLPSKYFGSNAAWWEIAVLAWNLHALLKLLALSGDLKDARFKKLRFHFINVPAKLVQHARRCVVRYFQEPVLALIQGMRGKILALAPG